MATEFSRAGSASVNVCGGQTFCEKEQKRRQSNIDNSQWQEVDASGLVYVVMIDRFIH
jgi:hypothetical protein